jgi:hypothetical protein
MPIHYERKEESQDTIHEIARLLIEEAEASIVPPTTNHP